MKPDPADRISRWATLRDAIGGEVALPGSTAYDQLPKPFNARFHDVRPQAVVRCVTPEDVAETISFLARARPRERDPQRRALLRAGTPRPAGVVIDVTPMRAVSVSDGVATVGAGARLGAVYDALQDHGLAIPAGTCPPVGIAGLALGGGLGILGRTYGVTSDQLVAGADRAGRRPHPGMRREPPRRPVLGAARVPAPATSASSRRSTSAPSRRPTATNVHADLAVLARPPPSSRHGRNGRRAGPTSSRRA